MRVFMLAVVALLLALPLSAQLTVTVIDQSSRAPIAGAAVELLAAGTVIQAAMTGGDGLVVFALGTSVAAMPDLRFRIGAPWPNPSAGVSTVPIEMDTPGRLRISVVDLMGRSMVTYSEDLSAGSHQARLALGGLRTGMYFVRVESRFGSTSRPVSLVARRDGAPSVTLEAGAAVEGVASKGALAAGDYVLRVTAGGYPVTTTFVRVESAGEYVPRVTAGGYPVTTTFVRLDSEVNVSVELRSGGRPGMVNSVNMEFIGIPAGTFTMGSNAGNESERPQHPVTLARDFWLGKYEVTQGEYFMVTNQRPSYFLGSDRLPVERVSWADAVDFANALSLRESRSACYDASRNPIGDLYACTGYRLPTEAEWEYATRAQTTTEYFFGNYPWPLGQYAWLWYNSDTGAGQRTHDVGGKLANPWGLYDVYGNLWERVHDWFGTYPSGSVTDPTGAASGTDRVYRGGGWGTGYTNYLRSAYRALGYDLSRGYDIGFRLARGAR